MRLLTHLGLVATLMLSCVAGNGQTYSSNNPGLFGIDGDIYSDAVLSGSFTAAGSHDWFQLSSGTGIGVFDTTGAAVAKAQISTGKNYSFTKKMQQAKFSTYGGLLLLDATYSRDEVAIGGTQLDKTMFNNSVIANSSAMNPTTWTALTAGGAPQDKTDIVDTYVHVRRLTNGNNHLIAYVAATTLGTSGNRYFDFELYRERITYDKTTGTFSNSGPAATGGHSAFTFKTDGSILSYGDMTLSVSFNSSAVQSIEIYIWTDYNSYSSLSPKDFSFTSNTWVGLNQHGGYGYAKIQPKTGNTLSAWGMVSTSATPAPAWGTNSKDLGSNPQGYYSPNYSIGQFGEAAIDLTSLGIDPYLGSSSSPCVPPFTRVFIKSRASSSFSAALADFVEPFEFLDISAPPATIIAAPANLSCSVTSTVLQPTTVQANTTYVWSTSSGSITTRTDSTYAVVNSTGKYYLTVTITGCNVSSVDSITVSKDNYAPIATAFYTGVLTSVPGSYVTLKGGDAVASNYSTPFGFSQGLTWAWSGPNSFISSTQDANTSVAGDYQLILTEVRNGCRDTAVVTVLNTALLSSALLSLNGSLQNNKVTLAWSVAENQLIDHFEIQRSINGGAFVNTASVQSSDRTGREKYTATDVLTNTNEVSYRLIVVKKDKSIIVSKDIRVSNETASSGIRLMQNIVDTRLAFEIESPSSGTATLNVYSATGVKISSQKSNFTKGANTGSIELSSFLKSGVYILELKNGNQRSVARFVKI
jgi:hypothetical protein